jgi:two-component system sensor histidine kinase RegB
MKKACPGCGNSPWKSSLPISIAMFQIGDSSGVSQNSTIAWLLRLRWTAVAGQFATILFVAFVLGIPLPLHPLMWILFLTAMSNGILHDIPASPRRNSGRLFGAILALDVILLTAMLYWTGGIHNPFTSFYLVHIALAAMMLRAKRLWALVALCVGCFAWLFFYYHPLDVMAHEEHDHGASFQLHLQGMAVAFLITSICIAYFVGRMQEALKEREVQLAESRLHAARNEQFSALATLSAGVAHELGSPLGTIAVVSRELERALEAGGNGMETLEDARLIRSEVERCRNILDRLNAKSTSGVGNAPERFDIEALLREIRTGLGPVCLARLKIENPEKLDEFFLPLAPLAQALAVLIQNACDADASHQPVTLGFKWERERVLFMVRDHGQGLSPGAQKRAGEPFFTTKQPGKGMGLGLFLVRTLASRLGGDLTLDSKPGSGTCAILSLPMPIHSPIQI